jgi:phage terminase small subunit
MQNQSDNKYPDPPGHLSDRSKQLWREFVGSRIRGPRVVSFQTALEYLDLADSARRERVEGGLVIRTKRSGLMHLNPVLKIEQDAREKFLKIWKQLGLNNPGLPESPFR